MTNLFHLISRFFIIIITVIIIIFFNPIEYFLVENGLNYLNLVILFYQFQKASNSNILEISLNINIIYPKKYLILFLLLLAL